MKLTRWHILIILAQRAKSRIWGGCVILPLWLVFFPVYSLYTVLRWFFIRKCKRAFEIARRIGYTDEMLLVSRADAGFLDSGRERVIYVTPESYGTLQAKMKQLGFKEMVGSVQPGSAIFTEVNNRPKHSLTANGKADMAILSRDGYTSAEMPDTAWWVQRRQGNKLTSVYMYKTSGSSIVYEYNGKRIVGNIIVVSYNT